MKITKVEVRKEMKIGLPNYSNITASCGVEAEVGKDEVVDWDVLWDEINQQLYIQSSSIDPSWIQTKEYTNYFKTTIKAKKENHE